ncbi:MAG TPA: sigma-54 dependent transcriptional regulator [Candidatus Binataceae bacterium]|nr:sigma-54 dependent transcriptional regulator [Candidatus Binataceae bacterium]
MSLLQPQVGDSILLSELLDAPRLGPMIVKSAKMQRVAKTIQRLGPYKSTILIQGESGSGKDLVARALHQCSAKANGPFIIFNCSNLVDSLAESQLFGHVKGAFTDAREDSLGYFRTADGGTLFLDEVGELPPALQPKLLRAVETHEIQPVGSSRSYQVDIRLIVATNRDLSAMVANNTFRADLYYRLNAISINVPPLRERFEEIETLVAYFAKLFAGEIGKSIDRISRSAMQMLTDYQWPGNLRELRHAIESAVMMAESNCIDIDDLPESVRTAAQNVETEGFSDGNSVASEPREITVTDYTVEESVGSPDSYLLNDAIKSALIRALRKANGNCHLAAKLLGISRYTVYRMMSRFGLGQVKSFREIGARDAIEHQSLLAASQS